MHFKSSFVVAASAAGLTSALPTKQGLPLVGDLMGGGGGGGSGLPLVGNLAGGGGGSGLPLVGNLAGGGGGSGLPLVGNLMGGGGQVQQYNSPSNNPYAYGPSSTSGNGGNGGILGGIFKRDDQAKDDTQSTQHTDCVNQCTSYCQQYLQDDDEENQCEQQCPQQCSQVLTSPVQSPLGQAPPHYGGQQGGQWQPGFGTGNNGNRFPTIGFPTNGFPNTGFNPNQQQGGQRLADPVTQPFRGNGQPGYPGSNGIASPVGNNFPGNNNNGFPSGLLQGNGLNEPADQAFCNIFDGIHSNTGLGAGAGAGAGQPATAPLGYGPPNPATNQFQTSPYGQSQCPLLQGAQAGQWQNGQQVESPPAPLETEAIVNYLHADIITKNRSRIEFASNELKRLEDRRSIPLFEKLITRLKTSKKHDDSKNTGTELGDMIRNAEAQLRQAEIIQDQVHTVSDMIIVALTAKEEVEEDDEILPRINALLKTLTSSALAKEIEGAREVLEMKSLKEVAEERAGSVDTATARREFLRVEGKWEAMRALGEWEGSFRCK